MEDQKNMPYFDEYVKYKILYDGASDNTIKNYTIHLRVFYNFTGGKININKKTFENFVQHLLMDRKESRNTVNARLMAIRSYFKYLYDEDIIDKEIHKVIKTVKVPEKEAKKIILEDKLFSLLDKITNVRDRALLETLYCTGAREGELSKFNIEDIDWEEGLIAIRKAKRMKSRIVPLNETAMKWIKAYIGVRKSGPLFLNNRATRLNERSIYTICKKYFDLPPHDIRHAFATHLLANTNNPEAVKDILGHSDVKFTMKTYTHLAHSHIKQIYKGGMRRA